MRRTSTFRAGIAVATAVVIALGVAGTAGADPNYDPDTGTGTAGTYPAGKTSAQVLAGVGADAFAELTNHFATAYNSRPGATDPVIASYDAVNPITGASSEQIQTKPGCSVARPNGANGGLGLILNNDLSQVASGGDGTSYCVDFVRASRGRDVGATGHAGEANLTFFEQSQDGVGYATVGNAYAPTTPLTAAQLKSIFECAVTDWSQVGGQAGAIHVYSQPDSAATWTFFLKAIGTTLANFKTGCGVGTPGDLTIPSQQNDGRTLKGDPQGIAAYAITKWAAQENEPPGIRDNRGGAVLGGIGSGVAPTKTQNLGGVDYEVLNDAFATANPTFVRFFYNAVRTTDKASFATLFGPTGYLCTNQDALLVPFGNRPLGSDTAAGHYCGREQ